MDRPVRPVRSILPTSLLFAANEAILSIFSEPTRPLPSPPRDEAIRTSSLYSTQVKDEEDENCDRVGIFPARGNHSKRWGSAMSPKVMPDRGWFRLRTCNG